MSNKDYTALVLVVDRSGSMRQIATTVQDALEEFVNKQVLEPGHLTIDTVFFDSEIEDRASFVNPKETTLDLSVTPRGMTALFDAVGLKIDSFGHALSLLPEEDRPSKVIFVIATDGLENSSKEFTLELVAEKIKHQQVKYSWDFTFIGANQDAVLTAASLNIPEASAITFTASNAGADSVLSSMSSYVTTARAGGVAGYSARERDEALAVPHDFTGGSMSGGKKVIDTSATPASLIVGLPGVGKSSAVKAKPESKTRTPHTKAPKKPAK